MIFVVKDLLTLVYKYDIENQISIEPVFLGRGMMHMIPEHMMFSL